MIVRSLLAQGQDNYRWARNSSRWRRSREGSFRFCLTLPMLANIMLCLRAMFVFVFYSFSDYGIYHRSGCVGGGAFPPRPSLKAPENASTANLVEAALPVSTD
jgi:hypothetical protein